MMRHVGKLGNIRSIKVDCTQNPLVHMTKSVIKRDILPENFNNLKYSLKTKIREPRDCRYENYLQSLGF